MKVQKRLRRNNQKGFTLIELLVVISILGILAAVVTLSLVGLTGRAQTNANDVTLRTVQAAFDTEVADLNVSPTSLCGAATAAGGAVTDLSAWPAGTPLYPTYVHTATSKVGIYCSSAANGVLAHT
jgi:prepilin-type N-terminal cleavage/methylation domain-containing protein